MATRKKTIAVREIARVEGEGALRVSIREGRVERVELRIFEPPRLFEAFLRGRHFHELPDLTARICGICPVAYQLSSIHAVERGLGVEVDDAVTELRRLFLCGEWIESHTLHVVMLHAPDFLGYDGAVEMARDHREAVVRGLALKKTGNAIMALLGGREIHPINARVGGFYRVPTRAELDRARPALEAAREAAEAMARWVAALEAPAFEATARELVALSPREAYPMDDDARIASSGGLDLDPAGYDAQVEEWQVPYSTALHARLPARAPILAGPLARHGLGFGRLPTAIRELAEALGLGPALPSPYRSILVRAIEVLYATDEALRIVERYRPPARPFVEAKPRRVVTCGAVEAPRGVLHHRYALDEEGMVLAARIVPPTSQNQRAIEEDLRSYVDAHLDAADEALRRGCEMVVRNHDPCISCATHALRVEIDRA